MDLKQELSYVLSSDCFRVVLFDMDPKPQIALQVKISVLRTRPEEGLAGGEPA